MKKIVILLSVMLFMVACEKGNDKRKAIKNGSKCMMRMEKLQRAFP